MLLHQLSVHRDEIQQMIPRPALEQIKLQLRLQVLQRSANGNPATSVSISYNVVYL